MLKKFNIFLFALMLSFSMTAHAGSVSTRIIGGTDVSEGALPFVVALLNTNGGVTEYSQQFCGGTLLNSEWVLTAAHCLKPFNGDYSKLRILVGATTLSTTTTGTHETRLPETVYIHENYQSGATYNNDIALIKLSTSVTATAIDDLSTASTPYYSDGDTAYVAGWGDTTASSLTTVYPSTMRFVDVGVVSDATCSSTYGASYTSNMFCAGYAGGGKDSCQGDSGGPLYTINGSTKNLIGIVSFGTGCAQPLYYGVYTKVKNYESWISSKIAAATDYETMTSDSGSTATTINGTAVTVQSTIYGISSLNTYYFASMSASAYGYTFKGILDFNASLLGTTSSAMVKLTLPGIDVSTLKLLKCSSSVAGIPTSCSEVAIERNTAGSWIKYIIYDGGSYDDDGSVNGVISDPVYLASGTYDSSDVPTVDTGSITAAAGGGGCSASKEGSAFSFAAMIAVSGFYLIRRRRRA